MPSQSPHITISGWVEFINYQIIKARPTLIFNLAENHLPTIYPQDAQDAQDALMKAA